MARLPTAKEIERQPLDAFQVAFSEWVARHQTALGPEQDTPVDTQIRRELEEGHRVWRQNLPDLELERIIARLKALPPDHVPLDNPLQGAEHGSGAPNRLNATQLIEDAERTIAARADAYSALRELRVRFVAEIEAALGAKVTEEMFEALVGATNTLIGSAGPKCRQAFVVLKEEVSTLQEHAHALTESFRRITHADEIPDLFTPVGDLQSLLGNSLVGYALSQVSMISLPSNRLVTALDDLAKRLDRWQSESGRYGLDPIGHREADSAVKAYRLYLIDFFEKVRGGAVWEPGISDRRARPNLRLPNFVKLIYWALPKDIHLAETNSAFIRAINREINRREATTSAKAPTTQ